MELERILEELRTGFRASGLQEYSRDSIILEKIIGKGGFSEVWQATLLGADGTGQTAAAKVIDERKLKESEQLRMRLKREVLVGADEQLKGAEHLTLPNGYSLDGRCIIFMELADGNMDAAVEGIRKEQGDGPTAARRILEIIEGAAQGLAELHDSGRIYRDLKPENILIRQEGGGPRVKLSDWGLVGWDLSHGGVGKETQELIEQDAFMGTKAYMHPDLLVDFADAAVNAKHSFDHYPLGVIIAETLFGYDLRPQQDAIDETILSARAGFRQRNDLEKTAERIGLPGLERVVIRLLDRDESREYGRTQEVLDDLELVLRGDGKRLEGKSANREAWLYRKGEREVRRLKTVARRRRRVAAAAGAGLVIAGLAAYETTLYLRSPLPILHEIAETGRLPGPKGQVELARRIADDYEAQMKREDIDKQRKAASQAFPTGSFDGRKGIFTTDNEGLYGGLFLRDLALLEGVTGSDFLAREYFRFAPRLSFTTDNTTEFRTPILGRFEGLVWFPDIRARHPRICSRELSETEMETVEERPELAGRMILGAWYDEGLGTFTSPIGRGGEGKSVDSRTIYSFLSLLAEIPLHYNETEFLGRNIDAFREWNDYPETIRTLVSEKGGVPVAAYLRAVISSAEKGTEYLLDKDGVAYDRVYVRKDDAGITKKTWEESKMGRLFWEQAAIADTLVKAVRTVDGILSSDGRNPHLATYANALRKEMKEPEYAAFVNRMEREREALLSLSEEMIERYCLALPKKGDALPPVFPPGSGRKNDQGDVGGGLYAADAIGHILLMKRNGLDTGQKEALMAARATILRIVFSTEHYYGRPWFPTIGEEYPFGLFGKGNLSPDYRGSLSGYAGLATENLMLEERKAKRKK